jgi:hypothetical protein
MKRLLAIVGLLSSAACTTTDPGSGARVAYHLPRTDASIAMDLTLTSCGPQITAEASVRVLPVAGAQDETFEVSGADLASAHIKRELTLSVRQDGVIVGINTSNEDQTPEIVGNIIKTAATVVPIVAAARLGREAPPPPALMCKDEVEAAVLRRNWLIREIQRLRTALGSVNAPRPDLVRQISRLATEQGDLEERVLHSVSFSAPITLTAGQAGGSVPFDYGDAAKWFKIDTANRTTAPASLDRLFGMDWVREIKPPVGIKPQPLPPRRRGLARCKFGIAVPAVREVEVKVTPQGTALPANAHASNVLAAAQFEDPATLCLSAGFGESRSVKLDFDEYGRSTAFTWTSSARAATISGAVAGYAGDLGTIYGTLEGPGRTAKQKTEIERLETQQRLNELRRCKAIIEAGGFDCKADEKSGSDDPPPASPGR